MGASSDSASVKPRSQFRTSVKHLAPLYEKFEPTEF